MDAYASTEAAAASGAAGLIVRDALSGDAIAVVAHGAEGRGRRHERWLSIRLVTSGAEQADHDGRRLRLDEDACLVLNAGTPWAPLARDGEPPASIVVAFEPRFVRSMLATSPPLEPLLGAVPSDAVFTECLRPRGEALGRAMERVAERVAGPARDGLDAAVASLLATAIEEERRLRGVADRIGCVKASTRRELLRRVLRARDHIESHGEQPIALADIAAAASLSRFHLVRLFRATLDTTPAACLRDKRLRVARRLLARPALDLDEVAARAGLGTRSSLFRLLRRELGNGGRALRAAVAGSEGARSSTARPPCRIRA